MGEADGGSRQVLICDLDGTLVDTVPGITHAMNHVLARRGLEGVDSELVRANIGGGARNLVAALLGPDRAGLLPDVLADFSVHYDNHAELDAAAYPGVLETLGELSKVMCLAIATAKSRAGTIRVLEYTGLAGFFEPIITMTEMPAPKPDPACVEMILCQLGIAPANALLVGDTLTDARTAANAGIGCWAVSYGYGTEPLRREGGYLRMIDRFTELRQLIPPMPVGHPTERDLHE